MNRWNRFRTWFSQDLGFVSMGEYWIGLLIIVFGLLGAYLWGLSYHHVGCPR